MGKWWAAKLGVSDLRASLRFAGREDLLPALAGTRGRLTWPEAERLAVRRGYSAPSDLASIREAGEEVLA